MFNTFLSPIWDSWFSDFLSDPFLAYVDAVRKKEKKENPPKFDTVEKDDKFIVYVKKDEGEIKDFVNDERMLVVTFTTVDGNETTTNKVEVYIPNIYSTNFIKTIDGDHFKYEFEKECNCENICNLKESTHTYDSCNSFNELFENYFEETKIGFIERNFKTYNRDTFTYVPFKLYPREKELIELLTKNDNVIVKHSRATGVTSTIAAWAAAHIILDNNFKMLCVAPKFDLGCAFISKVTEYLRQVPSWYFLCDNSSKITNKTLTLCSKSKVEACNGNGVYVISGPRSAEESLRGCCQQNPPQITHVLFEECAFIEDIDFDRYMNLINSVASKSRASSILGCETPGKTPNIIIVSTPNSKPSRFQDLYTDSEEGLTEFKPFEMLWYHDPRYNKNLTWYTDGNKYEILAEETDEFGNIEYDPIRWEKLMNKGWKPTSPWYRKMRSVLTRDVAKFELDCEFPTTKQTYGKDEIDLIIDVDKQCEKEHKCCKEKCCCTKKHDGLERTLKWMEDELEEAIGIGDDDLKKYLSEQIKVLKSILGKKNKTKEIRCGNKIMSLDEQCRISRN